MTNEGMQGEAPEGQSGQAADMVAYVGRGYFRMERTPMPEQPAGDTGGIVAARNHEDTLRIRIPAPLPPPGSDLARSSRRGALATVVATLRSRLELPRWAVGSLTALMFSGGLLFAASVAGSPGTSRARAAAAPAAARDQPALPSRTALVAVPSPAPVPRPGPLVEPLAPARPAAAPTPGRPDAPRRATRPAPAAATMPSRHPRLASKSAAPASDWVDPFAE